MFEEKLAILCNKNDNLLKIKMSRWSSKRFYKFKTNSSYFLFSRGACEGLNAMFADLILAFGLHAAKYSRGTLLLKELHMFLGVYWSPALRAKFSLFDPGQSQSSGDIKAGCSLSSSSTGLRLVATHSGLVPGKLQLFRKSDPKCLSFDTLYFIQPSFRQ